MTLAQTIRTDETFPLYWKDNHPPIRVLPRMLLIQAAIGIMALEELENQG